MSYGTMEDMMDTIKKLKPRGVLYIILCIILAVGVVWTLSYFAPARHTRTVADMGGTVVRTTVTPDCPGDHRKIELGDTPQVINPGSRCIVNFTVAEGPIEFNGPTGLLVVGTREEVNLPTVWLETARAPTGRGVLLYQLVQ